MLAEAPAPSEEAAKLFAVGGTRARAVQSYTSKLHVDFVLRSFPYLKFHLKGHIEYKRPNLYSVHFDHVPWFGKGFENMKMDPLEPQTWPEHYDIASIAHKATARTSRCATRSPGTSRASTPSSTPTVCAASSGSTSTAGASTCA